MGDTLARLKEIGTAVAPGALLEPVAAVATIAIAIVGLGVGLRALQYRYRRD
jgi:hypothetical protein